VKISADDMLNDLHGFSDDRAKEFAPILTSAVKVTLRGHQNDRSSHILEIPRPLRALEVDDVWKNERPISFADKSIRFIRLTLAIANDHFN
jgi:hypothetical protein